MPLFFYALIKSFAFVYHLRHSDFQWNSLNGWTKIVLQPINQILNYFNVTIVFDVYKEFGSNFYWCFDCCFDYIHWKYKILIFNEFFCLWSIKNTSFFYWWVLEMLYKCSQKNPFLYQRLSPILHQTQYDMAYVAEKHSLHIAITN